MKRQLEQAIKSAGGTAKAAALELGVKAGTVRRWLKNYAKKGSKARANADEKIGVYKERRVLARKAKSDDLKLLKKLRAEAEQITAAYSSKTGKADPLKPAKTFDRKMDGRIASGYMWAQAWSRQLTDDVAREVFAWARTKPKQRRFPFFMMVARLVEFSPEEKMSTPDSGQSIEVQVDHPAANQFIAEIPLPTPKLRTLSAVIEHLGRGFAKMLSGGGTVFILDTTLYNYLLPEHEMRW